MYCKYFLFIKIRNMIVLKVFIDIIGANTQCLTDWFDIICLDICLYS